jgi:hypothetical protein
MQEDKIIIRQIYRLNIGGDILLAAGLLLTIIGFVLGVVYGIKLFPLPSIAMLCIGLAMLLRNLARKKETKWRETLEAKSKHKDRQ